MFYTKERDEEISLMQKDINNLKVDYLSMFRLIKDYNEKIHKICKHEHGFNFDKTNIFGDGLVECRICGQSTKYDYIEFNKLKDKQAYNEAKKVVEEYEKKEVDDAK